MHLLCVNQVLTKSPTNVRQLISQQVTVGPEPAGALQVYTVLQGIATYPGTRRQLS